MASVSLDWKTGDAPKDVARDLRQLGDAAGETTAKATRTSTLSVERQAKFNAPVDTGRLKSSISSEVRKQPTVTKGFVGSNVEYADIMEFGSRPHRIEGDPLAFKWPNAPPSQVAYAMRAGSYPYFWYGAVSHPGTEPTFFLSRAVEAERPAFYRRLRRAVRKAEREASDD